MENNNIKLDISLDNIYEDNTSMDGKRLTIKVSRNMFDDLIEEEKSELEVEATSSDKKGSVKD
jgi:hypothetical protein